MEAELFLTFTVLLTARRSRWCLLVVEPACEHKERLMLMMPAATFVARRWSSADSGAFTPATCRCLPMIFACTPASQRSGLMAVVSLQPGSEASCVACAPAVVGERRIGGWERAAQSGAEKWSRERGDHLASWLLFIEERMLAVALTEFQGDQRHSGRAHGFVESWEFASLASKSGGLR
jgi:hypothetical protein